MAEKIYIGVGETAKSVKDVYIGINGTARKIKKGYIGINGVARQFYEAKNARVFNISPNTSYSGSGSASAAVGSDNFWVMRSSISYGGKAEASWILSGLKAGDAVQITAYQNASRQAPSNANSISWCAEPSSSYTFITKLYGNSYRTYSYTMTTDGKIKVESKSTGGLLCDTSISISAIAINGIELPRGSTGDIIVEM